MSYILDALNKADQARKQGEEVIPPEKTIDSSSIQQRENSVPLFTLLAFSLGLLLYWFAPWQAQKEQQAAVPVIPQNKPTEKQDSFTPLVQSNLNQHNKAQSNQQQVSPEQNLFAEKSKPSLQEQTTNSQPIEEIEVEVIPAIMDLPQSVLNDLPDIKISAHTYSTKKGKRMVIINDKVLRENRYISEHLILKSITRRGVELEFDGIRFSMTAFDSWPY